MKESRRSCTGVRNTSLPGLLADPALAEWLGDYHATSRAQDSPLHRNKKAVLFDPALFLLILLASMLQVTIHGAADSLSFLSKIKASPDSN